MDIAACIRPAGSRSLRVALSAAGATCLALGALGLVVPLLPTTVFWIAAAWCFAKSSPRLAQRLLTHPRYGRALADWLCHGVLDARAKRCASLGILASLTLTLPVTPLPVAVLLACGATTLLVYLLTRPERRPG